MRKPGYRKFHKGSVTVEAAIALPAFICAVITVAFLLKVIYVQEMIQHAISETADEIASYSYIYAATGLNRIHDELNSGLEKGSQKAKSQMRTLVNTYDCFTSYAKETKQKIAEGIEDIRTADPDGVIDRLDELDRSAEELEKRLEDTKKVAQEIAENPKQELKYIINAFAKYGFEGVKAEILLKPITKACLTKYLKYSNSEDINQRLKRMNVVGGFEGLDFEDSRLFEDGKNIDIVIKYKMSVPVPFNIIPEIPVVQRVKVRAWLNGDNEDAEDIWTLGNLERGRKIQKMYGRNLPDNFKTITRFENGTAALVTSINLNAETYKKKPRTVLYEINKAIKALESFEKDRKTKDENGRTIEYYIEAKDINYRRIITVIPKGSRNKEFNKIFEECRKNAESNNIELTIDEL